MAIESMGSAPGASVEQHAGASMSSGTRNQDPYSRGGWLTRELVPGTVINSKYCVDKVLGRGAMGVVVACEHLELRERVALKFLLRKGHAGDDEFAARFLREAQVCAKLKNQHITRVVDVGIWREEAPFMVMEHLDGSDLRQVMRRQGRMPVELAIGYVVQLCQGLAEAHARGIVHRDLKPSNVFVVRNVDGSDLVKILDFGISKVTSPDSDEGAVAEMTETGLVMGSPKYMSPEQLFEPTSVGPHSDVWALGIMLYEMLMGRPPFEAPSLAHAIAWLSSEKLPPPLCAEGSDVSPALEAIIFRCIARKASQRTPNVAMLAGDLLSAIGSPNADSVFASLEAILATHVERDGLRRGIAVSGDEGTTSSGGSRHTPSLKLQGPPPGRWKIAAVSAVGLVGLAAGLGVWWSHRLIAQPAAAATQHVPAPPSSVHVVIRATPPDATIEVDGQDRGSAPVSFDALGDPQDHAIRVSARGYVAEQRTVQFSSDLQVDIALGKLTGTPQPTAGIKAPAVGSVVVAPSRGPAPRATVTPMTAASTGESRCLPPYYFANGIKTFKPECL